MGADIYLNSIYERQNEKWRPIFEQAVKNRDKFCQRYGEMTDPKLKLQYDKLQAYVNEAYEMMAEAGYFRDSYNDTSLFWMLGLSWAKLSDELLDEDYNLPIEAARRHLAVVETARDRFDPLFAAWVERERQGKSTARGDAYDLEGNNFTGEDNTVADWEAYFREKLDRWIALLKQSIELNEPLHWSV